MYDDLATEVVDAIQLGNLVWRDALFIQPKDRSTGDRVDYGFWTDYGLKTISVIDALTRLEVDTRSFQGVGTVTSLDPLTETSDTTVRELNVGLSQIDAQVASAIRGYDAKYAPVQVYRGLMDPATRDFIAPMFPRFAGIVSDMTITDPAVGGYGSVTLVLSSQMIELTRVSTAYRSDASQRLRNASDGFYLHSTIAASRNIWWGEKNGVVGG